MMHSTNRSNAAEQMARGADNWTVLTGDAFDLLPRLAPESIDLILTSPPYWGLRDYEGDHNWQILDDWMAQGNDKEEIPSYEWYREHGGMLGLEPLPEWYIHNIALLLDLAHVVLKQAGSLWLNIGDTYFARWSSIRPKGRQGLAGEERHRRRTPMGKYRQEKQLLLIPSRTAIELQNRGWILRNDLIWYKPNVPPRPFKDRLALTHEHFFHFVKRWSDRRPTYYYDLNAAGETPHDVVKLNVRAGRDGHSATFPRALIEPRILSSCPVGGTVLDPFCGVGTTLAVAVENHRKAIGFDVNDRFVTAAKRQLERVVPFLICPR